MEKLLESFGIDYKILIAQIINFALIFFLLYKFLFNPLKKVIEERRKKIYDGLKKWQESEKLIRRVKKLRSVILKKISEEREKALLEIEEMKRKRLEEVMQEISDMREKMISNLEKQKETMERDLYLKLEEKAPKILMEISKKFLSREDLNEEFINNILSKK
ncbi:MAG: ATP synthase F0 subunit B [Candidatus Aenigmatarchaeota archaeon]|jgi:F-type H+-transporting ATPase subunit b